MEITASIASDRDGSGIAAFMRYSSPAVEIDEDARRVVIRDVGTQDETALTLAARLFDAGEIG